MQALYRDVGRPASLILCRLWASQRLDLALSLALQAAVPGGMGVALSRVVRLAVAAKIASSVQSHRKPTAVATPDGEDSDGEEEEDSDGRANDAAPPPAGPTAGAPSRGTSRRSHLPAPKGLGLGGGLPRGGGGMILPAVPPGGLACCSVQPIGLPLMLTGQAAARAPMYAMHGDRLVRGLAGLAATLLLCRAVKTPFNGRLVRLPPRTIEYVFQTVLGPAAAMSYLATSAAGQAGGSADKALCQRTTPMLQQLYSRLRAAGEGEAERGGRGVVFASTGPSVDAIPRSDVNACCLPGGIIFVHSGLIKAVQGRQESLSFVLGHEMGHAIGRHSLEKAVSTYMGMFAVDAAVGLAQRLLKGLAPEADDAWIAGPLRTLDGLLQSCMYLAQLSQSRSHEYEADQLALELGGGAGMDKRVEVGRRSLFAGATDVLRRFMKMEAGAASLAAAAAAAAQADSPLSTHPAAGNRLKRLEEAYRGGGAAV